MFDTMSPSSSALGEMTPNRFYAVVNVLKTVDQNVIRELDEFMQASAPVLENIDKDVRSIAQANNDLVQELRITTKRNKDPFRADQEQDFRNYTHSMSQHNFIRVAYDMCNIVQSGYYLLIQIAEGLKPRELLLSEDNLLTQKRSVETIQKMMYEMQLNRAAVTSFLSAVERLDNVNVAVANLASKAHNILEGYYSKLSNRHSVEGVEIFRDAIVTDVAISIYENVDSHGEIEGGKKADEVSAYTMRKAELIGNALKNGLLSQFVSEPNAFLKFITDNLRALRQTAQALQSLFKRQIDGIRGVVDAKDSFAKKMSEYDFNDALDTLNDLDPRNVVYKEKTVILTAEERFNLKFRNETLSEIVRLLSDKKAGVTEMIGYILNRKSELKAFFQDDNSFFVCKIGAGNPFLGEAPGALSVVPGQRPIGNLDDIVGSGFSEVKSFIKGIEDSAKWHDLFIATSPSGTADKSNVLLVGPPGCHRKGQLILMYDGSLKAVEDIAVGDKLMGPDSGPRQVMKLHRGHEEMMEIVPNKGESWVVNKNHILTLVRMGRKKNSGKVIDVSVSEYMTWSSYMRREYKLFRTGVEFESTELPLSPYFLGALLGDGSITACPGLTTGDAELVDEAYRQASIFGLHVTVSHDKNSNVARYYLAGKCHSINPVMRILRDLNLGGVVTQDKFIPHIYKISSRRERLELLAGLLDTDGSLSDNCFDFQNSSEKLATDVAFVARSLGFAVSLTSFERKNTRYFRVKISGSTSEIPTKLPRKQASVRKQIKNVLRIGFSLRELDVEEYFGFTVDKDHRYLLGDFTVTHNCGKSEVMRAVGADKKSISIFAQGSDFNTCWKGEQEKNPKRLFEAGLRLQKESRKHVHFLIDEIDSVLNDDKEQGASNLTLEFQILMDGVVRYPNLSVWGATNNPDRIPMPMIRRFSKVLIVGELSQADRVHLLKHFVGYLPMKDFTEEAWNALALKLEGATGDVMRKIADHIWRTKMSWFVTHHSKEAEEMVTSLNKGEKFQVTEFGEAAKREFKTRLGKSMSVVPDDVDISIRLHLNNMAIRSEIATAKETYSAAKRFLEHVNSGQV